VECTIDHSEFNRTLMAFFAISWILKEPNIPKS